MAAFRRSTGERRREMTKGFAIVGGASAVALVVILVGLSGGSAPARPPGIPDEEQVVLGPEDTKATTGSGAITTTTAPPGATATAAPTVAPTLQVLAIGDSVMQGAAETLHGTLNGAKPPAQVDAAQSRQFSTGVDDLQGYADRGELPTDVVVVHLGTNGAVDPADLERMMAILAKVRKVVVLTAKAPRPWEQQVNDTINAARGRYENLVIVDWHTIGGAHPEYFWDDAIHLRPAGAAAYSHLVLSNL